MIEVLGSTAPQSVVLTGCGTMRLDLPPTINDSVECVWVDQGYTGHRAATAAAKHGIALEVVNLPGAKRGFFLLPRR